MNNKAFSNLFCNPQLHLQKILQQAIKFSVNAFVEFEEWLTASIIRVGRSRSGVKTLLWIAE